MKSSARAVGELRVEGDHHQLLDAEPVDHVALDREGHDQLRQRRRVQDLQRVRVEGEDGVGVVDHRLVAEVDAVEGPDRDVARPRLGVGQRGDPDAHRSAAATAGTSSATRSTSTSLAGVLDPEGPDRGAAQLRAVGVAERLDQGADVGPGRALDLVVGAAVAGWRAARPGGPRRRARASRPPRRGGPSCRGARRRPAPPRSSAPAGAPSRSAAPASPGTRAGLGQLAVGVAGAGAPAEPGRRQVGLRQADQEALQPGRAAEQDQQQAGREGVEGAGVAGFAAALAAHLGDDVVRGDSRPACRRAAPPLRDRRRPRSGAELGGDLVAEERRPARRARGRWRSRRRACARRPRSCGRSPRRRRRPRWSAG